MKNASYASPVLTIIFFRGYNYDHDLKYYGTGMLYALE